MKFQVSRALPQKNPKAQGGSGFGFFQVFAHSNMYVITALIFSHIERQNVLFLSMCIITLHCAPEESRSLSFSALVQLTEEH